MNPRTTDNPLPDDDRRLEDLLDEALGAGPAPPGLVNRIERATLPLLPAPTVLARIGPAPLRAAAAAAIVIGAAVALLSVSPSAGFDPALEQRLVELDDQLGDDFLADRVIDEQIDLLGMRADLLDLDRDLSAARWADASELIDEAVMDYQLNELTGDMALFF